MKGIFLLLGSNLGDRQEHIVKAIALIEKDIGKVIKRSSIYETAAWGIKEQPDFLNMVVEVDSKLSPEAILDQIELIEKTVGRKRIKKWGSRSIDVDILYYSDHIVDTKRLTIPHSRIGERKFTLIPMCEIAPEFIHPVFQKSQLVLLKDCTDDLIVQLFKN